MSFIFGFINFGLSIFISPAFMAPISFLGGIISQFLSLPIGLFIGFFMLFGNY